MRASRSLKRSVVYRPRSRRQPRSDLRRLLGYQVIGRAAVVSRDDFAITAEYAIVGVTYPKPHLRVVSPVSAKSLRETRRAVLRPIWGTRLS